ncbi:DUF4286 family protein [Streptomyces sp. NPDC050264]|uniref:DUF4286 family protein n=1 Tax=Streptomyces sp. NPDC050264 TaxID=3155038 RepID=UPI00342A1884
MSDNAQPGREVLLALTNPVEGKDEEFQDWYWETHIPEILALPGFKAARRYRVADSAADTVPYRYVTLYEVEGSADEARGRLFTSGLGTSDTLDVASVAMIPLVPEDDAPRG